MKFLTLIVLLAFTCDLMAFNGRKCDSLMRKKGGWGLFDFSTTSAFQFFSSTGECSAIGLNREDQKKMFYYVNFEQLQNDIARGSGENLSSLLVLSGCGEVNDLPLRKQLKESFETIFNKDLDQSYDYISPLLDNYCRNESRKTLTI